MITPSQRSLTPMMISAALMACADQPKPAANQNVEPSPELAWMSCETKDGAKEIRATREIMELFSASCWILHPDKEEIVGEEDGFIKLRVKRDRSIRWTVRREQQAPIPEPELASPTLTEQERRNIFTEIVRAEDRADGEAEKRYPITCVTSPVSQQTRRSHHALGEELSERYRNEVLKRYDITAEQKEAISDEAFREGWPLPPNYDPCK